MNNVPDNAKKAQRRIRVLCVVPTFYPAVYFGGPIYSLFGLCNALARPGDTELRVLTTDSAGPARRNRLAIQDFPVRRPEGYEIYYCRKGGSREFSGKLLTLLFPMIRWADVVHLTSAYSFSTVPTLFLCRLLGKPVVWSPRGALQRWEGSTRLVLKKAWELVCNLLLRYKQSVLHVTSGSEAEESGRRITRARIEIIENGVDVPETVPDRAWMPEGAVRLLFIGRLDPKKGIENLLQAMKQLDDRVSLTICGAGDSAYEFSLRGLVGNLSLERRINFAGHVTGDAKSRAFWEADICVIPSYTENFGMVVAEALAHGVPVISSRGTPWERLTEHQCGIWVENDPASLARAVTEMRGQDLARMGKKGRQWMQESYSWMAVARRMRAVYGRLYGHDGVKP